MNRSDVRRPPLEVAVAWVISVAQDVRYTARGLRRAPTFTVVMLVTLALGIGANTAVFSVVFALLLNPIAYRDAGRVVLVWHTIAGPDFDLTPSQASIDVWQREAHSFDGIETYTIGDHTLTGHGEPQTIHTASVSATFGQFTGVDLIRGRGFRAEETRSGAPPVALLSEHVWRSQFGADEQALNREMVLDGNPYTIIGVASEHWRLPSVFARTQTDVWLPLIIDSRRAGGMTVGRLKPDVSADAAMKELDVLSARVTAHVNRTGAAEHAKVVRIGASIWFRQILLMLAGAVVMLLLIACTNVAHLLLARSAARQREFAVRYALGATRARLTRQLVVESAATGLAGCVAGVFVGWLGLRAIVALRPSSLDAIGLATLNGTVLGFTALVSLVTGVAFGLGGALHAARTATAESLTRSSAAGTASREGRRVRAMLVVTEMALSAALLVGAVLLVRTVVNLQRVDPGFDTAGLFVMKFDLPGARYSTDAQRAQFADRLLERARKIPGVVEPTTASNVPPQQGGIVFGALEASDISSSPRQAEVIYATQVRPDFFSTVRIRLLEGRTFDAGSALRNEAIINSGIAKALWPGEDAVGRRFRVKPETGGTAQSWYTVAAVVSNVAFNGLKSDPRAPMLYLPSRTGTEWGGPTLVFRVRPGPDPLASMRRLALDIDPNLVPPPVVSIHEAMRDTIASQRFTMLLLAVFAGLAALLSAIGLYGVIACVVAERSREIGIRIALGGTRSRIARLVMGGGVAMCMAGLAIGLIGASWGTALLKSQLFGVAAGDPLSYVVGSGLLFGVSLLACVVPLRRAMAIDPLIAMRSE